MLLVKVFAGLALILGSFVLKRLWYYNVDPVGRRLWEATHRQ